jgi:hypothetical protein
MQHATQMNKTSYFMVLHSLEPVIATFQVFVTVLRKPRLFLLVDYPTSGHVTMLEP